MDDKQRLQLQDMIKTNNVEDQTDLIRSLKHSRLLANDINSMIMIKAKYRNDPAKIDLECLSQCGFLYSCYTDIYNKVKKDEIDLTTLNKFLNVLERIEEGDIDQHTGSFLVGTLLKELYIDSALKKADKLNEKHETPTTTKDFKAISWKQFKTNNV
jgi:hypothetical protein